MSRAPFSLSDTWNHVGELYAWIISVFGDAEAIAAQLMLTRARRRDLLAWLGPVEALARRLLLLKALTLPPPNQPAPHAATGRLAIAFTDAPEPSPEESPERWRVIFRVMPNAACPRRAADTAFANERSQDKRATSFNAFALARRIEALRRVLENPKPALARLARALATRRSAIVRAFAPYRPRPLCAAEALAETQGALDLALNSS
jgi:hypothetical protein